MIETDGASLAIGASHEINKNSPIPIWRPDATMATAKLNGLEPVAWLTETLEKLPTCPNYQLDTLLPFAGNRRPLASGTSGTAARLRWNGFLV